MILNNKILFFVSCFFSLLLKAQVADSDIFLFEMKKLPTTIIIHKGENIIKRVGYDNQPFFMPDNKSLLFVAMKEDKQADIYKYELSSKKTTQLTHSTTSEFSPILSPDGKSISVVMVEADSTQRIWSFNKDSSSFKLLTEKEDSMERVAVQSRDLAIVGYDLKSQMLEITFRRGGVYRYQNVPETIFKGLMAAASHGTYFNQNIKDKYRCEKVS